MDIALGSNSSLGLPGGAALIALGLGCFFFGTAIAPDVFPNRDCLVGTPFVKSLGSVQRSVDVAPGSDGSNGSAAQQKVQSSSIQSLWKKQDSVSYSTLLSDIDANQIKQLVGAGGGGQGRTTMVAGSPFRSSRTTTKSFVLQRARAHR